MRALWWSAAALALLAVAGALGTPQVEGARTGRRFPAQATTDENPSLSKIEDVTKPRLRNSRRREELQPTTPKQVIRSRTRSKPTDTTDNITSKPEVKSRIVNSERYHTRRTYNRTHDRTNENNSNLDSSRDNVIRSRTRYNRPAPTQPTLTTKSTELTSPTIDESKIEVINSTLDEIPKMVFNDEPATTEFKRRSSTVQVSETITPKRIRGRINNRVTEKSGDLASSGTTNSISISEKGPTTDRMIGDLRNARKLRYKSRITDTDTNLTGLGITTSNEVKQSSQNKISPSQVENHSPAPEVVENVVQQSTETNPLKTTTVKVMRIVRRPLQRGKVNFKPTIPLAKKSSDEISDDDNYPESFKALLQAKNVSTQTSSPKSESLSVKASQKIFNTYTTSQQSTFTSPGRNKYSGLRSKHNSGEGSDKILEENFTTTAKPVVISSRQPDFKFRGTFSSRSRKASGFTSSPRPEGLSTDSSTEKPSYKFNRKFKVTTAIPNPDIKLNSKRVETSNLLKRTLNRPTYNSRRNSNRSDVTSTAAPVSSVTGNKLNTIENHSRNKSTLPRTSYYSRQKNVISNNKINPSTEEPSVNNKNVIESAARKNEDNADMPLIFTLLKPTETLEDNNLQGNESNKPIEHKMFVIAVTSKESQETSTEHEMTLNTVEEGEGRPVIDISSTPKYHAIYTEPQSTEPEKQEQGNPNTIKPIKNINTRKFGRSKSNQPDEDTSNYNINRERGSGKYTGSYSKTTEASTNGIILEPEKSKNRFSSKYRASYIDKPFYRATVPTVTPSTAWLKFFVTDRLLTKFVEEPNWFTEEDYYDVTTEPMTRHNVTPQFIHESPIELIEGEEYQLGPDMNAISFTQTRSPDELFKMSESLVKPHVMNVQATHHSPSVTVSIFDALAEILTSTPRNRLSSTTEVLQNQNIISDSKKTPNGVSSSIVVKSVGDFSNQDTFVLANVNVNTKAKPVQTTDQFTQNVNNLSSVEENVTPSLSTQERVLASLTTSQPLPTPIPTTPISARKPFAIKFLYSDTEKPTDQLMTASEPTSNQPSTDNPKMISSSALNLKDSSTLGVTTATNTLSAEKSTASHVLSLRTTTMLPSVDEILLNSISSAVKEEMVISSMTSSTREPTILTLDIDPETKQIRTEKPSDGSDGAVFKYIPIDEVTVSSQNSNVLKLASSKSPTTEISQTQVMSVTTVTETNTQTPQIPTLPITDDPTTTVQITAGTSIETSSETVTMQSPLAKTSTEIIDTTPVTSFTATSQTSITATTEIMSTTLKPETTVSVTTESTTFTSASTSEAETKMTPLSTTMSYSTDGVTKEESKSYEEDAKLLQALLAGTERNPKNINFDVPDQKIGTSAVNTKTASIKLSQPTEEEQLLQALLSAVGNNQGTASLPKDSNNKVSTKTPTTTTRSIEDDIRQFEEDTKLLKALLQATGQNPANFNIPTIDNLQKNAIFTSTIASTTEITTTPQTTESTKLPTTTRATDTNTKQRLADDAILQALLQATNQNNGNYDIPVISGITSNVRISSNPRTTSLGSSPTTPINVRPIYTTISTSPKPILSTFTVPTTLQPRVPVATATENVRISTTFAPFNQRGRTQTTTPVESTTAATGRQVPSSPSTITTELPSSSTYSVEEDLAFLQNLKSVLNTNANPSDPESALANRIIALAVDRSLNEIKSGDPTKRNGKNIIPTTTTSSTTTTTTTTTTTPRPKEPTSSTPSIEDDIRQFQEDSKLLQALLKATGQDPSKYNIPSLPNIDTNVSPQLTPEVNSDLNLLSNLLASPSPLNEPFDSLTQKPQTNIPMVSPKPFGAKIAVKDDLKSVQDDAKLLQTLIQLQGAQETTTLKSKIAVTGQSTDEALKKLIQQTKPTGMVPEATKMPLAISTEYGKSNDALLAALLKEQGFGPTTASSLDEQLRLAALLNQVVVTPKARRTTTPPPPPPAPRRPILDGLAWLWQQWRETGPGPGGSRPSRRPEPSPTSSMSVSQTSNRANWFGSGPFLGNAGDRPTNRIPLDPPRAVTSEQTPGRGQLVSAAINVTRAFSQFLGAAIQGAAQTVQNVIRAGQRAATDVYSNGSGASG